MQFKILYNWSRMLWLLVKDKILSFLCPGTRNGSKTWSVAAWAKTRGNSLILQTRNVKAQKQNLMGNSDTNNIVSTWTTKCGICMASHDNASGLSCDHKITACNGCIPDTEPIICKIATPADLENNYLNFLLISCISEAL